MDRLHKPLLLQIESAAREVSLRTDDQRCAHSRPDWMRFASGKPRFLHQSRCGHPWRGTSERLSAATPGRRRAATRGSLPSQSQWATATVCIPSAQCRGKPNEGGTRGNRSPTTTDTEEDLTVEEQIAHLRELFADAPEVGKKAFENVFNALTVQAPKTPPPSVVSAGTCAAYSSRQGLRVARSSSPAPGGAERTRAFLRLLNGNLAGADDVGSVHDMRFVFLDNDTKMLFATAYDGDWDTYIDDFVAHPDYLDIIDSGVGRLAGDRQPACEGLPRRASGHRGRLVRRQ